MGQPKPLVIDVKLSCLLKSCWTSLITDTTNCLKRDFEISIDTQGLRGNYRPHYVLLAISKLGHWRLLKENCFSINIWEWRVYVTQCHRSKLLQKMSCNFFVWSQKTPNTTTKSLLFDHCAMCGVQFCVQQLLFWFWLKRVTAILKNVLRLSTNTWEGQKHSQFRWKMHYSATTPSNWRYSFLPPI